MASIISHQNPATSSSSSPFPQSFTAFVLDKLTENIFNWICILFVRRLIRIN
ncbi:uncharacterized protein DS421_3g97030 [Arachis hypogaea]|nr:uncharacterized protein DS421_3g97030 [Arachis hypogaea]